MKLYRESQVKRMMQLARETYASEGQILLSFEPIELPSDEEIEERAERNVNKYSFIDGVEWLKDKILNK